ncbi:MAG: hypothetical protein ACREFO_16155 [Acetobacteraceae bacterium]
MASFPDLTAIARRLLNIEVNTIISTAMTAEPMPAVPHALLDIAGWYADALASMGVDLAPYFAPGAGDAGSIAFAWAGADSPPWDGAALTVRLETFDRLRWAAKRAANSPEAARHIGPRHAVLLQRIVNNADAIKEIIRRFNPTMRQFENKTRADLLKTPLRPDSYSVAPDDLALLQKIWDIGTDQIVAQTIVYLTGDVTTRMQESLAKPGAEPIFAIHRQSVDVSIKYWKSLLEVIREIAGAAVSVLLGARK